MLDTTHDAGLIEGILIGGPTLTDGTEAVAEPLAVAGKGSLHDARCFTARRSGKPAAGGCGARWRSGPRPTPALAADGGSLACPGFYGPLDH